MEKPFKNTEKNDETVEKMSEGIPRPTKKNCQKKKNAKLILRPFHSHWDTLITGWFVMDNPSIHG